LCRAKIGLADRTAGKILGRSMRIVGLLGLLLALSGCASERSIAFIYYPNHLGADKFPLTAQFAAEAQKECGKYGLVAVHDWESVTDFQRVRSFWRCVQR
jgi:hypothetical protein